MFAGRFPWTRTGKYARLLDCPSPDLKLAIHTAGKAHRRSGGGGAERWWIDGDGDRIT